MIDIQDKLEKVREFIQANPGKSNRWYADNNGIIKKTTFYKYLNDIVVDNQTDTLDGQTDNESANASSDEIIQNLLDEHEKNEDRKSKNRQYNYNTRSRKALVEELQKENEELKDKYEELKSRYEQLQTDFIFEKQLKEKYINQIHDLPFKQSEFDELKKKYDNLQIEYITLKTGDKSDKQDKSDKPDKPETKTQQWWEEI